MSDDSDSSTEALISSEEEEDDEDDSTERIISSEEDDTVDRADVASVASTNGNQQAEPEVIDIGNSDDEEDPPHHRDDSLHTEVDSPHPEANLPEEQRQYRDCSLVCPELLQEHRRKDPQDPIPAADWVEMTYVNSSDEEDEGTFHQINANIYLPLNCVKSILS